MHSNPSLALLVCALVGTGSAAAQAPRSQTPDAENLDGWLAFLRPSPAERSYEEIGWRNRFWPAVQEAQALGRPILLWTMNGHPLGCT